MRERPPNVNWEYWPTEDWGVGYDPVSSLTVIDRDSVGLVHAKGQEIRRTIGFQRPPSESDATGVP